MCMVGEQLYNDWLSFSGYLGLPVEQTISAGNQTWWFVDERERVVSVDHSGCKLLLVGSLQSPYPVFACHEIPFGSYPVNNETQLKDNASGFYGATEWYKFLQSEGYEPFAVALSTRQTDEPSVNKATRQAEKFGYKVPPFKVHVVPFSTYDVQVSRGFADEPIVITTHSKNINEAPLWTSCVY